MLMLKPTQIALVCAALLALSWPAGARNGPRKPGPFPGMHSHGPPMGPPLWGLWRDPVVVRGLAITSGQKKQLETLDHKTHRALQAIFKREWNAHAGMKKAFSLYPVDQNAVRVHQGTLASLHAQKMRILISARVMVHSILTEKQLKLLASRPRPPRPPHP
jgi:hypothetical protein